MEVQRGVGDVVEAVGGGGQSRAGLYHQTHSSSRQATANQRVLECGGAVHVEPRKQALQPHPHPHTESSTEACTSYRQARAQRLSPVLCAQRRGPGLTRGSQDTCWV